MATSTTRFTTLDPSGLRESTMVVFLSDHGEYGGVHNHMLEKWHAAYQEALHVPVLVQPAAINPNPDMRQVDALTSHVDIVPTLLGLCGIDAGEVATIRSDLQRERPVPPFADTDLSPVIRGEASAVLEPDGSPREGVLFVTDDEVTGRLPRDQGPVDTHYDHDFEVFLQVVEAARTGSSKVLHSGPVLALTPGPVRQPNHLRCVRTSQYPPNGLLRPRHPRGRHPPPQAARPLRSRKTLPPRRRGRRESPECAP